MAYPDLPSLECFLPCILVMMKIKVLFFGVTHDLAGLQQEEAEIPEGANLDGLWERYAARFPRLNDLSHACFCWP